MSDTAEEAEGEVIYSYDGKEEDPVELSLLPTALEGRGLPTASEAFEAFAGKGYKPTSWNIAFHFSTGVGSSMTETILERVWCDLFETQAERFLVMANSVSRQNGCCVLVDADYSLCNRREHWRSAILYWYILYKTPDDLIGFDE